MGLNAVSPEGRSQIHGVAQSDAVIVRGQPGARGVAPGRGMGAALKTIEALWIAADFPGDAETLARLLGEALTRRV